MPFNDPLMSATIWLLSLVWTWWIARSIEGRARVESGQAVVQYGPGIRALAYVGWIVAVAFTLIALLEPLFPWWARVYISLSAFFIAAVLHAEFHHALVRYDMLGMHFISPWRGDRLLAWDDVRRVAYDSFNDVYKIESATQGKFKLHKYMSGIESLIEELAERGVQVNLDH